MIKDILKMGGCKTEEEFYKKYPTEESFFEAFPQARPMLEQFFKGGDIEAFPQARPMLGKGGNFNFEPFPQARPMLGNYAKGGNLEAFPQARMYPFNTYQMGGGMEDPMAMQQNMMPMQQDMGAGSPMQNQDAQMDPNDPMQALVMTVSQKYQIDPEAIVQILQKLPQEVVERLYLIAANNIEQASKDLASLISKDSIDSTMLMAKLGGPTSFLNTSNQEMTGGAFDQYTGGSVFNYGQFPAILEEGGPKMKGSTKRGIKKRLKGFSKPAMEDIQNSEPQMDDILMMPQDEGGVPIPFYPPLNYDIYMNQTLPVELKEQFMKEIQEENKMNQAQQMTFAAKGSSIPMNTESTYVDDKLKTFIEKIHAYAEKGAVDEAYEQQQQQEQQMMMPQQMPMGRRGFEALTKFQYSGEPEEEEDDTEYTDLPPGTIDSNDFMTPRQYRRQKRREFNKLAKDSGYPGAFSRWFTERGWDMKKMFDNVSDKYDQFDMLLGVNNIPNPFDLFKPIGQGLKQINPFKRRRTESQYNWEGVMGPWPEQYGEPAEGSYYDYDDQGNVVSKSMDEKTKCPPGYKYDEKTGGCVIAKTRVGKFLQNAKESWQGLSGVERAEKLLNTTSAIVRGKERANQVKADQELEDQMFNPAFWVNPRSNDERLGYWGSNIFDFAPDRAGSLIQFTGAYARNGGQLPSAKSGLEVRMNPGMGFNANQLSWPVMAGEFSQEDIEVKNTLRPVPRDEANVEVELGEQIVKATKDGIPESYRAGGKRHYDNGTPLDLPDNSYVYSRDRSMFIKDKEILADFGITNAPKKGVSPADIARKYDLNKYKKTLLDKTSDQLAIDTAERNIVNANLKLGKLALIQESMKNFPEGIPMIATPYLQSVGIEPDMLPQPKTQELDDQANPAPNMARYGANIISQFQTKRKGGMSLPIKQAPPGEQNSWIFNDPKPKGDSISGTVTNVKPPPQEESFAQMVLKQVPQVNYYDLEDTDFVNPQTKWSTIGYPFLADMNYNNPDNILKNKTYFDPLNQRLVPADANKDGRISQEEWDAINTVTGNFRDNLDKLEFEDSSRTGFGQMLSVFNPSDIFGFSNADMVDDMSDMLATKMSDFADRSSVLVDMDTNKDYVATAKKMVEQTKQDLKKISMIPIQKRTWDENNKIFTLENKLYKLEYYIKTAEESILDEQNKFVKVYVSPHGGGGMRYIYGDTPTRIPTFDKFYEKGFKKELEEEDPAAGSNADDEVASGSPAVPVTKQGVEEEKKKAAAQQQQQIQVKQEQQKQPKVKQQQTKVVQPPQNAPITIEQAKKLLAPNPKYGGDPSKVSDQDAMNYMKFLYPNYFKKQGGQQMSYDGLPKKQVPPSQVKFDTQDVNIVNELANLGYEQARPIGWNEAWPGAGWQTKSTGWNVNAQGLWSNAAAGFDPDINNLKINPNVDWSSFPGANGDADAGFNLFKTAMARAKGRESAASAWYNDRNQNAYTTLNPNSSYTVIGDRTRRNRQGDIVGNIPGYEWFTQPWFVKSKPKEEPCKVCCDGTTPVRDEKGNCPPCPECDPEEGETPQYKERGLSVPFWTQDMVNMGAAFRNLDIKKYNPTAINYGWSPANPVYESPERALAAVSQEPSNLAAQYAANFGDASTFGATMSGVTSKAADAGAKVLADVHNRNVQTANQFELYNNSNLNKYLQYNTDRLNKLHAENVTADQQYRNAIREGRDQLRQQFVNAWTNRGMTQTMNAMYGDQFYVDPYTGFTVFKEGRKFDYKTPTTSDMPSNIKTVYDRLIAMNTPESLEKASNIFIKWSESQGSGLGSNKRIADSNEALIRFFEAMSNRSS